MGNDSIVAPFGSCNKPKIVMPKRDEHSSKTNKNTPKPPNELQAPLKGKKKQKGNTRVPKLPKDPPFTGACPPANQKSDTGDGRKLIGLSSSSEQAPHSFDKKEITAVRSRPPDCAPHIRAL